MRLPISYVSLLLLACVCAVHAQPTAQAPITLKIQKPAGPFGIGRVAFEWTDARRNADNAEESTTEAASMMVYLWYPTAAVGTSAGAALLPGAKEIDVSPGLVPGFKTGPIFGGNWNSVVSGQIKSHAQEGAALVNSPRRFPVLIFSPGAFGSSFEYTGAIEQFVSHGYVVATIEHSYETFAVAFPNGKVRVLPIQGIKRKYLSPPNSSPDGAQERLNAWIRHRADFRASDMSFVLDKITDLDHQSAGAQFSGRLDLSRVGAVGHSRGGWAAVIACRRDKRFRACINEDGSAGGEGLDFPDTPLPTQPILYIEIPKTVEVPKDWPELSKLHLTPEQWLTQWHANVRKEFTSFPSGGSFVVLDLPGAEHYSFSDRPMLQAEKLGDVEKGEIAERNLEACEGLTLTFLDHYLKDNLHSVLRSGNGVTVEQFPQIK